VWGQFVDEPSGAGTPLPTYHTFLYDGTNTTDLGKTTGANFAGDRIAWATDGGINIYRISDKSNTLVPGAKDVTNLVIDGDKSIVWNENKVGTLGVSAQTLKFYDGTKVVDLVTLPAGKDLYTQPSQITAAVSGNQVVYTIPGILNAPGALYLYNNGQSTKISDNVNPTLGFGINGDRVFYHVNNTALAAERTYSISSGKTENPIDVTAFNPNTDGKNSTWVTQESVFLTPTDPFHKDNLYIDDSTTDATIKGFGVSALTQKSTNKVNEISIFAVDDLTGKIGSFAPGTPEYLKAVLDIAKPIFTTLAGDFLNKSNQEFSIDPNKTYQFFEIQDGSIGELKQQIASGKTPKNLLFSLPDASGNSPIKVTNNSNNDGYQISVNADELVLNVVRLAGAAVTSSIGSKSQNLPDSKTDLNITGGQIYAPVVVTQGTFNDFVDKNPTNGGCANNIHAYFNYIGANSDKTDHFRLIGNNTFGVEDMYGGGDRDFNDLVVKMNVKFAT
jgi:hypothetical protein